jgi:hypothetical protein
MTSPNAAESIAEDKDDLRYGEKQPQRKGGRPIEKLNYGHDCRMSSKINH